MTSSNWRGKHKSLSRGESWSMAELADAAVAEERVENTGDGANSGPISNLPPPRPPPPTTTTHTHHPTSLFLSRSFSQDNYSVRQGTLDQHERQQHERQQPSCITYRISLQAGLVSQKFAIKNTRLDLASSLLLPIALETRWLGVQKICRIGLRSLF